MSSFTVKLWKAVKMIKFKCKFDFKCFLDEWNRIKKFFSFSNLTWIIYLDLSRNLENWLIFKFVFIHFKTVKCQSRWSNSNVNITYKCFLYEWNRIKKFYSFSNWFRSLFLMNGKELRIFGHFQILTKIAYPYLNWNLQID